MEPNVYFFIILITVFVLYKLDLFSEILNLKALGNQLPKEFEGTFEQEDYEKSQEYTRERTRFGIISDTFSLAVFLVFWFIGGFNWLDQIVRGMVEGPILRGLLYISILYVANMLISLPFSIYSTFVIEEKYGFNKTKPATFAIDRIKGLVLSGAIGLPILALILWIFQTWELAWLYAFILVAVISLALTYVAPKWIMPLFNEFKPLDDEELKKDIQVMAEKCEFPIQEVSVMDGSKRSSKSNAFFTGFGKNKKIALFDTLVERQTNSELVAVLAHEIGHFKKKHIQQQMIFGFAQLAATFYLLSLFLENEGLFAAFGVEETSVYLSLIFFGLLFEPINKVISIFTTIWSRKNEFEADAYAAEVTGEPETMITALKKLSKDNLSNLTPHPFYVFLNYSHPPVLQRIQALRREATA